MATKQQSTGHFGVLPFNPNKGHQGSTTVHVGENLETASITSKDTTPDWEWSFPSLSVLGDDSLYKNWYSLLSRGMAEFLGTTFQVFMIGFVFMFTYNSSLPAGNLLAGRLADYIGVILATTLTAGALHGAFWGESCKFNPFLSIWTIAIAQSNKYDLTFNFARAGAEIVGQVVGGILGAACIFWIQPVILTRTYFTAGIPFYDADVTSTGQAVGLQILSQILISYVFCRIQYGIVKKTHMQAQSLQMGFAYGGAAIVTYFTGSSTTFVRWFGAACVTGIFNIATDATTVVDATIDNVVSPAWVYLTGDAVGTLIGVFIVYIVLFRPQARTMGSSYKRV
jgi:glycerol uptake facilitator-like aquaporin